MTSEDRKNAALRLYFSPNSEKKDPRGALLALGCFDGMHEGHRALLMEAKKEARRLSLPLGVWSPEGAKRVYALTLGARRANDFFALGADFYAAASFAAVQDLSPEAFFEEELLGRFAVRGLACGENFTFGKDAAGNASTLRHLCRQAGVRLLVVPTVCDPAGPVSSARVREALKAGKPEEAAALLGRPYGFSGVVQKGRRVGRKLGFPTANIALPLGPDGLPGVRCGVYAAGVSVEGGAPLEAVANLGIHPTFEKAEQPLCEAHLLRSPAQELYGKEIYIELYRFLRPEIAFGSAGELQAQLQKDLLCAKEFFTSGAQQALPPLAKRENGE